MSWRSCNRKENRKKPKITTNKSLIAIHVQEVQKGKREKTNTVMKETESADHQDKEETVGTAKGIIAEEMGEETDDFDYQILWKNVFTVIHQSILIINPTTCKYSDKKDI
jgi:hypothetical protein